MRTVPITSPLPGEHLAATSPRMQPETDTASWLRLNFWAGRALTADALELEQQHRGGRLAWRGRAATPGIVRGLEAALEPPAAPPTELTRAGYFVHLLPGHGFLADGEDVVVARPLRIPLDAIPIEYVRVGALNHQPPFEAPPAGATPSVSIDTGSRIVLVDRFPDGHVPWAAVLVVCPAELRAVEGLDPDDPCELDPSTEPFADDRRVDAAIVRLCELPAAWQTLPLVGDGGDVRWRNRLAHVVFSEEARSSARQWSEAQNDDPRWQTTLRSAEPLPWEWLGVPVALLGSEQLAAASPRTFFLDRATVARHGGIARPRTRPALRAALVGDDPAATPSGAGTPINWRARIDQFAAHMSLFATGDGAAMAALQARFQFVPAAGFLPRAALDFLTSEQSLALPQVQGQLPDRAGISHFFPSTFAVDAVPVAVEDLDAALASSAPLAPYDFASATSEPVRLLVPVPQRLFDPGLLVVEQEDPVFVATVNRFAAIRQGWRQRRDVVRTRRDALQALSNGPQPVTPPLPLEPGQLEPEPVESVESLGFTKALVSPIATAGPWEISVAASGTLGGSVDDAFFVVVRADEDAIPSRIEARWTVDGVELRQIWTSPLPVPPERSGDAGDALASSLWIHLAVPAIELGATGGQLTRLTLHVDDGRLAMAAAGITIHNADGTSDQTFWHAGDQGAPEFVGGEWTAISGDQLLAPFEDDYDPVFPDGRTRAQRVDEVDTALNPAGATARAVAMSVATDGLVRVLSELDSEANQADDFVDAHFTRAQVNLYRIRKLMLGQTAAQKLLVNPAIAAIAEQETATASADQLQTFVAAAKKRAVTASAVTTALQGPARTRAGGALSFGAVSAFVPLNPAVSPAVNIIGAAAANIGAVAAAAELVVPAQPAFSLQQIAAARQTAEIDLKTAALRDVIGERPESGPTLPPRGLSIGQRFTEPPATQNLSYARADLTELLKQLTTLRLPLVGETVKALNGQDVVLLALQGRVVPPPPPATGTAPTTESIRQAAVTSLLTFDAPAGDTDEAEVTLAALDFTEIKSAILRTIERVIQQRRSIIQKGLEALGLINDQGDAAAARVLAIEGKLAETRQDVSVARALRQEEQQRVAGVNDERDRIVRDEVKFLAYTRPRTVELVRRRTPYWQLDLFGAPAPVPACLQRHDDPPAPLNAYIELFNAAPVRWFTALEPLLLRLDTPDKVITLIEASKASAIAFKAINPAASVRAASEAVQFTVLGAHQMISAIRLKTASVEIGDKRTRRWQDFQRDAREHATVGDLIAGRFGARDVSSAATAELELIGQVATCFHAEFAAIAPAVRLAWIERFSQFDQPAPLRDLTVLPLYAKLDRATRRRLQSFADWLFGRVTSAEGDAVNLINDLVRLCLLLASHAPVNQIIAGHVPRPTPVRPGLSIPIRPLNPEQVRIGMQFQVWQTSRVVAHGLVEDLVQGEVTARVNGVAANTTTLDPSMRVQFVPAALKLIR